MAITINFKTRNPRRNLPLHSSRKRKESNFVNAFERCYSLNQDHIISKEFHLFGFGIADLVTVPLVNKFDHSFDLTAFEMKLKNWRSALMQAYRYSYFANQSIVVLPPDVIDSARFNISHFLNMNIGLWEFNSKENRIIEIFTPKVNSPKNFVAHNKAKDLIFGKINFCELSK